MVKYIFVIFLVILLGGCIGHQNLVLTRQNNLSQKIALNGYFFTVWNNKYYDPIFLYENGVVLHGFNEKYELNIDSLDRQFLSHSFLNNNGYREKVRYKWGLYQIKGDSIIIERYAVPIFGERHQTYVAKGVIINNQQFVLTHVRFIKDGREKAIRDTFNFRPLPIKPDSTNNFIQ